jgi:hypothetical protein
MELRSKGLHGIRGLDGCIEELCLYFKRKDDMQRVGYAG